jgi:hypothetical protein
MDLLKYKTATLSDGTVTVPTGLNLSQILAVKRQGIQHDYVSLLGINTSNRCWSFTSWNKRIIFNSNFPGVGDETIYIMYKVTV